MCFDVLVVVDGIEVCGVDVVGCDGLYGVECCGYFE